MVQQVSAVLYCVKKRYVYLILHVQFDLFECLQNTMSSRVRKHRRVNQIYKNLIKESETNEIVILLKCSHFLDSKETSVQYSSDLNIFASVAQEVPSSIN